MKVIEEKYIREFKNDTEENSIGDFKEYYGIIAIGKATVPYTRKLTITDLDINNNVYYTDYILLEEKYDHYFDDVDMFFNS